VVQVHVGAPILVLTVVYQQHSALWARQSGCNSRRSTQIVPGRSDCDTIVPAVIDLIRVAQLPGVPGVQRRHEVNMCERVWNHPLALESHSPVGRAVLRQRSAKPL
jgi:hypothetical protein